MAYPDDGNPQVANAIRFWQQQGNEQMARYVWAANNGGDTSGGAPAITQQQAQAANVPYNPPATATAQPTTSQEQRNAQTIIQSLLRQYRLTDLIPWANQAIIDGATADEISLQLYDPTSTPGKVVATIYPEIQGRVNQGLSPISIDQAQQYHDTLKGLARRYGLPPGFYDTDAEASDLLLKDVSPAELQTRITDGFVRAQQSDPSIRDAFANFYGPSGDSALAAYFLDPSKAVPLLEQHLATATVAGVGSQFGFHFNADQSSNLAMRGVDETRARTGFERLRELQPLFNESVSESTNLTAEGEGANAVFNTGEGQVALEQRLKQRTAAFAGSGGGISSDAGQTGLGSARSR